MRILIAGAGIGGLMTALALAQKGFDVAVYEQAAQLGEVGAGVQMSANGSRLFDELGIGDELSAVERLVETLRMRVLLRMIRDSE